MDWDFNELSGEEGAGASLAGDSFDWKAVPYEVRGLLGRGGMGAGYRAYDPSARREVALKVMRQESLSGPALARFRQEGEIAASLAHPNVLQIHGVWEVPPHTALVYELVEGARTIDEAWGEDPRERVRLIRDAARGLAAAHARGVVHRDIKPDNLLVDATGRLRVSDFGIAFANRPDRLTQTGAMVGTPVYMSPEQFHRKKDPSPASDVWALGVLLYLALGDELPFLGADFQTLLSQVRGGATSQVLGRLRGAPPALVEVLRRALRPDPAARFPEAGALADALDAWLEGRESARGGGRLWLLAAAALGALGLLALGLWPATPAPSSLASPSRTVFQSPTLAPEPRHPTPPPAHLLAALESTEGARSGLAALELQRRWPEGPHAEAAQLRVERLEHEPLAKLYARLPKGLSKKDWAVAFEPRGESYSILGLADKCGLYARWDFETGALTSTRLIPLSWSLSEIFPGRGLAIPKSDPGLLMIDLAGTKDRWLIPRGTGPRVLDMSWSSGDVCWVLGAERLFSYRGDGEQLRSYPLPHSTREGRLEPGREGDILVALGDEEAVRSEFYSLSPKTGTWGKLLELPGSSPQMTYHAGRETLLAATRGGVLGVLVREREQVFPRRPRQGGFRTLNLEFRADGETFWSYGHAAGKNTPCRLELMRVQAGELQVLATRVIPVVTGDSCLSPCGRFWLIGLAKNPERGQAAEVWYVGPEVLPGE